MADSWAYTNVSTKQGNTDGEFMFEFSPFELGRNKAEEDAVRADLEMIFGHKLNSYKLEHIFLTLQEFQVLTIKYGDFFDRDITTYKLPAGVDPLTAAPIRRRAIEHYAGISSGMSDLDSSNTVRATNLARNADGNRIGVLLEGRRERAILYFSKTKKNNKAAASAEYRDIAIGDVLMLEAYDIESADETTVELKHPIPTFHFAVEKHNHVLVERADPAKKPKYYYISTVTQEYASKVRGNNVGFPLGFIAAVNKTNPFKSTSPSNVNYYQIREPSTQRGFFSVVLTNVHDDDNIAFGNSGVLLAQIGAPVPQEKENQPTAGMKRTAEQASLPISASTTSAKINRQQSKNVNPAT